MQRCCFPHLFFTVLLFSSVHSFKDESFKHEFENLIIDDIDWDNAAAAPASSPGEEERKVDQTSRHEVLSLPGYSGPFQSRIFSGYLTVDLVLGNHLFYTFVESERNPEKDPVVLWLNGGPGCSSFDGFVYEQGPFNFDFNNGDVKLKPNPYAWSKVANMIFLDSPAGVGLSYSDLALKVYYTDDKKTTSDLHIALLKFFELFPDFQPNKFFIFGESYAGIYIPVLSSLILHGNEEQSSSPINLIGYGLGNPVTDMIYDSNAYIPFAWGKSLISRKSFDAITTACDGFYWRTYRGTTCHELQREVFVKQLSKLNRYNVAGKCEHPPKAFVANQNKLEFENMENKFVDENGMVWPFGGVPSNGRVHNWRTATNMEAPCLDFWTAETWLNNPDVRKALHAAPYKVSGKFLICSDRIFYTKTITSTLNYHYELLHTYIISALIYSGDHDLAVPHTGTEAWTSAMMVEPEIPWQPWISPDHQVSGYFMESKGLTYCTIRNGGHMVPTTHPLQALDMFTRFITNLSLVKPTPT